ncbi:hypothetical protein R5R35_002881 [Gryllus longicercus]|uniref:Uncharacterized protein n=1 Tax=Gryllus longicercus TaxID=2509291 RepID=A0AAN9VB05_9ORTH
MEIPDKSSLFKRRGRGRRHPPRVLAKSRERMVLKNGECNISRRRVLGSQRMRLVQDLFTSMVDLPWRWILLILGISFFGSWLFFGVLWWIVAYAHGDLEPDHLPAMQKENNWTPCLTEVYNFTSCFLFSMENQHTTGFGGRAPTEECPEAIFLMCAQAIVGVTLQTAMLGIVFAKIIRPKQRTRTILFSDNAVVCLRDGALCLMFRLADMRKSHIIEASMHVLLVQRRVTAEGELLDPFRTALRVEGPRGSGRGRSGFFLLWPETVTHVLDKRSPLYDMSFDDLARARFEVVVMLEGTIESTDQRIQARCSYLPEEILWGHRFEQLMHFNHAVQNFEVDYSLLNATYQVHTPVCSAKQLDALRARGVAPSDLPALALTYAPTNASAAPAPATASDDAAEGEVRVVVSSADSPVPTLAPAGVAPLAALDPAFKPLMDHDAASSGSDD